jgi:hypothetical protein
MNEIQTLGFQMPAYLINKFKPQFDIERKPRCLMYQIATTSKPRSWYLRVRRKDGTYFNQSLEETNRAEALRLAQQVYIEILSAETRGVVYGKHTFKRLFEMWFKQHNTGKERKYAIKSRYKRYLNWFDNYEVHNINETTFAKYLLWRVSYWENYEIKESERGVGKHKKGGVYHTTQVPSQTSLKAERQILIQVLRWASSRSLLDVVPVINSDMRAYEAEHTELKGKINYKKTRGNPIPDANFKRIMGKLRHWAIEDNTDLHKEHSYARLRLYYFILITNNSLIRLGTEATRLRWKDLGRVKSKQDKDVWLYYFEIKEGKKQRYGEDETIKFLTPAGLVYLLQWRKIQQERYSIGFKDDEFVFSQVNGGETPTSYMSRLFRRLLLKWDEEGYAAAKRARKHKTYIPLAHDKAGVSTSLYSFRHTKISNLLIHSGRSIAEVSRMADTSLLQISRAYFKTTMLADADRYADMSIDRNAVERMTEEDKQWIADALKDLDM